MPALYAEFNDGDVITVEPWRSAAFPVIKDCMVDRTAFDKIMQAGGYVRRSHRTKPQGCQRHPSSRRKNPPKPRQWTALQRYRLPAVDVWLLRQERFSNALFVSSKVSQLALLPPRGRLRQPSVRQGNDCQDGGAQIPGNCTNTRACEAECPKMESIVNHARLNREVHQDKARRLIVLENNIVSKMTDGCVASKGAAHPFFLTRS